jgi:putative peptidoglycan lipid II flippase
VERIERENNLPSKAVQTAARTAVIMAVLMALSKLLGFARELVMAAFYGTNYIVDAYVMAQSIPSILFMGIFGAVVTAYMPLLSEKMEQGSQGEGNRFTSQVLNILFVASAISAVVGLLFPNQITALLAKGFTGETAALTSYYLKVTFAYTIFSATAAILDAYLQYKGSFIPQVIVGYTQSAIIILTIVICAYTDHHFLAYGALIAYVVRYFLFYILAKRKEYKYTLRNENNRETFMLIMPLAIPVFVGHFGTQINMFVDKYLASGLAEGSVAALNYGNLLNGTVMALSTTVISTIIYPKLSQENALGNRDSVEAISKAGVALTILIALPFSAGAVVYSNEVVQIFFERGAFDSVATELTQGAYRFYSLGMTFMALNTLVTNFYYAIKDTRRPMYFALVSVVVNIVVNLMLVGSMQHCGLALATSCAAVVNSVLLYVGLRHFHDIDVAPGWGKIGKIAFASIVSVGLSFVCHRGLMAALWMPRMVYLGIAVCVAVGAYLVLLKVMKVEELNILKSVVKRNYEKTGD